MVVNYRRINAVFNRIQSCQFILQRVRIHFASFNLPRCTSCLCGKINIYDGPNVNSERICVHCGTQVPEDIISGGNTVLVKNDVRYSTYSFVLQYTVVEGTPNCCVTCIIIIIIIS